MIRTLINRWWPEAPIQEEWSRKLEAFYTENSDYHTMTAEGSKLDHPQVRLLLSLIDPDKQYCEIGCGGGQACAAVGATAAVTGYDISPIAVGNAQRVYRETKATFEVASAYRIPLPDDSVDGVYSFEVLEHLWDPAAVIREMARVLKPGGFMLVSCPHHFSLDLHLKKNLLVRTLEFLFAGIVYVQHLFVGTQYVNLVPDICGPSVYPDCDQVSSFVSWTLIPFLRSLGLTPQFLDTYYMCALRSGSKTDLAFQRNARCPVIKWFGDHILFLALKE